MQQSEDAYVHETKNPIARILVNNYYAALTKLLAYIPAGGPASIFEAGCGDGYVTEWMKHLYPGAGITAIDIDEAKISIAKSRVRGVDFGVGNIYDTRQRDDSFDLVVSTEVLEHLSDPLAALKELNRIGGNHFLFSVPNEPIWRIANMSRGAYLRHWGNTPGHINHWSIRSLSDLLGEVFTIEGIRAPFPYTIILCKKRRGSPGNGPQEKGAK